MRLIKASKSLIGIDIGSTAVKLLEVKKSRGTYRVESYAIRPLAKGTVVDGHIEDADDVTQALVQALDEARPATRKAAIALPAHLAITQTLVFPAELDEQAIEERLLAESDHPLAFPFTDVAFDFVTQDPAPGAPHLQQVLLVACRQQDLWPWTSVVARAGLDPVAVDISTFALARAFSVLGASGPDDGSATCAGLVEVTLGAQREATMTLHVLHEGQVVYTQESRLARLADMARMPSALWSNSLAQQVNRALRLYYATQDALAPTHLVLVGDGASAPGLAAQLSKACGIEVILGDPLGAVGSSKQLTQRREHQALAEDSARLMTACGLALRVVP
ncbi:type IV pilus assembly protein PilM [Halomonas aquamarina]|uniref:Type IV pilus assembly protein PilM n=1 Tax=Vreelandella aquamarina TaxID=77097 RepID=A0ACC5VSG1_9GAMM|nr:type IV pilus assembly protein PilM [Halomonas aquamarina]MBZ5487190.1 type IV pilus assembly protein PilM [Halomonas aquamarina]